MALMVEYIFSIREFFVFPNHGSAGNPRRNRQPVARMEDIDRRGRARSIRVPAENAKRILSAQFAVVGGNIFQDQFGGHAQPQPAPTGFFDPDRAITFAKPPLQENQAGFQVFGKFG